ncbi:MAG: ATP-binding protein [Jatrophihabitantaceae bacterium]
MNSESARRDGDHVTIRIPADGVYIATLRLATASLAARCDLTVDDIEDLRLAVDEACALLLPHASADGTLDADFGLAHAQLTVEASVAAGDSADIDRGGFAWTVLGALATSVDVSNSGGRLAISVTKRREAALP